VPDTVDGLHAYFIGEKKKRIRRKHDRRPRPGLGTSLARSAARSSRRCTIRQHRHLPIGGGGKTILGVFAREALVNGLIEAVEQPIVAHNRAESASI
jgi:hypothetical protein